MCSSVAGRFYTLVQTFVVDGSKILPESLEALGTMQ
jgi:hypothetical protein